MRASLSLQGAQFQTGRCLFAGHAYLAQQKPREASAVFGRARERAAAATERWRECEHPDAAALAELEAVNVQTEAGPSTSACCMRAAASAAHTHLCSLQNRLLSPTPGHS